MGSVGKVTEQIRRALGCFPAFMAPAKASSQALDALWRQFRDSYLDNGLPSSFKDKLLAGLGNRAACSYWRAWHVAALCNGGVDDQQIERLLMRPLPNEELISQSLKKLAEAPRKQAWPEDGSALEDALLCLCEAAFLGQLPAGLVAQSIQKAVGETASANLTLLLAHARSMHQWVSAHPDTRPDAHVRRRLASLLKRRPSLGQWLTESPGSSEELRQLAISARELVAPADPRTLTILLNTPCPLMLYSEDGHVVLLNDIWTQLTGYSLGDVPTLAAWHEKSQPQVPPPAPEDIDALYELDQRIEEGQQTVLTRNGAELTWDFTSIPFGRLPGGRRAVIRMAEDITQRQQLEKTLGSANERMGSILESITDGFFSLDRDWCFVYVNERAEQLLRRPRQDLIGHNLWEEFPAAEEYGLREKAHLALYEQVTVHAQLYSWHTDRWFEYHIYPSADGLSVYFRESTERMRTEEALRETNQRLQGLIEASPLAIVALDREGNCALWSPAAERIFGWTAKEALGKPLPWLTAEELPQAMAMHHAAMDEGRTVTFERRRRRKDGRPIDLSAWVAPLLDGRGQRVGSVAIIADVTEQVAMAEALRRANQRLHMIIEAPPIAITAVDNQDRVTLWSSGAQCIFGWKACEVIGQELPAVPPGERANVAAVFQEIRRTGKPVRVEGQRQTRDGRLLDVEVWTAPLYDAAGRCDGIMAVVADVTERVAMAEALRQANQRLQAIIQAPPLAVAVLDRKDRLTLWSPGAERLFGWTAQEVLGKEPPMILPEHRQQARETRASLLKGGLSACLERPSQTKDGRIVQTAVWSAPLYDAAGCCDGLMAVIADITEQKRAEMALRASDERNRALLSALPDVMLQIRRDGTYMDYYAADPATLAVPPEQFLGKRMSDAVPAPVAAAAMAALEAALRDGQPQCLEYPMTIRGEQRYHEARLAPCGSDSILAIVRDVTDRHRAELALQDANRTLDALVRSTPHAVVNIALDGIVKTWNPAAERLFGWTAAEVIGRPMPIIPPDRQEQFQANVRQLMAGQWSGPVLLPCLRKDGAAVLVQLDIAQVRDSDGRMCSLMGIMHPAEGNGHRALQEARGA